MEFKCVFLQMMWDFVSFSIIHFKPLKQIHEWNFIWAKYEKENKCYLI